MVSQIKKINQDKDFLTSSRRRRKFSPSGLFLFLVFWCGFFGLGYIFQVNKLAVMGYEMKDYEEQIKNLEEETEQLKIELASLQSIYLLEEKKEDLKMTNPQRVEYLEVNMSTKLVLAE